MKKKLLSCLLVFAMLGSSLSCFAAGQSGLDNFVQKNTYRSGQFQDVSAGAWYAPTVQYAYELDLVKGTSGTTFTPDGNIKIAESIALACRLHSIYFTGSSNFQQGTPWYQVYVDYATYNGIIQPGQFKNYTAYATRAEFASILEAALPDTALEAINYIGELPDVSWYSPYAEAIYTLYNAGVLTGSDTQGTFYPNKSIRRSEVATIVARMADPDMRRTLSFEEPWATLSVASDQLTISQTEDLYFTVECEEDFTITWECDSDCIALSWGEFEELSDTVSQIPLTITPLRNGDTSFRVYIDEYPEASVTVQVSVRMQEKAGVFDYLMDYSIDYGQYSNGLSIYPLYMESSDTEAISSLIYDWEEENIILWFSMEDYESESLTMTILEPDLSTPYELAFEFTMDSIDLIGLARVYPYSFTGDLPLSFYEKSDNDYALREVWDGCEEVAALMLEATLLFLEEDVLIPGGYSLEDLGFYSI